METVTGEARRTLNDGGIVADSVAIHAQDGTVTAMRSRVRGDSFVSLDVGSLAIEEKRSIPLIRLGRYAS